MGKEHLIAKATIQAFILKKKKFTYSELQREIVKRKGILRVSLCVTVADRLRTLEEKGIIRHIPKTDKCENLFIRKKYNYC